MKLVCIMFFISGKQKIFSLCTISKQNQIKFMLFHGLTNYMISLTNSQTPLFFTLGDTPIAPKLPTHQPEFFSPSAKDSSSSVLKSSPLEKFKKEGNRWQPDSYSSERELSQFILMVSSSSVSAVNGTCLNPFLVQAFNHLH